MATSLTKTTKTVKRGLVIFGIVSLLIIIISYIVSLQRSKLPALNDKTTPGYPKANEIFGKLPNPELTSIKISDKSKKLVAKSVEQFPDFPPVAYVYKIAAPREYSGEANKVRKSATKLGFPEIETKTVENEMIWETIERDKTFSYNLALKTWSFKYSKPKISNTELQKPEEYINIANSYINNLGISDITISTGRVQPIELGNDWSINSESKNINAMKVALYKSIKLIEPTDKKIKVPNALTRTFNYSDGIANFIITGDGKNIDQDLQSFDFVNRTYEERGIYNIYSAEEAYIFIQANKGYLYYLKLDNENEYSKRNEILTIEEYRIQPDQTELIYIEPNIDPQKIDKAWKYYVQPYYLFSGTFRTTLGEKGKMAIIFPATGLSDL